MQPVAYGPYAASMALRLKASFHASPVAIMALLTKHRLHQSKNPALRAEKSGPPPTPPKGGDYLRTVDVELGKFKAFVLEKMFFSEAVFLPLKMSYVA